MLDRYGYTEEITSNGWVAWLELASMIKSANMEALISLPPARSRWGWSMRRCVNALPETGVA
jgi:hypothetical protein